MRRYEVHLISQLCTNNLSSKNFILFIKPGFYVVDEEPADLCIDVTKSLVETVSKPFFESVIALIEKVFDQVSIMCCV